MLIKTLKGVSYKSYLLRLIDSAKLLDFLVGNITCTLHNARSKNCMKYKDCKKCNKCKDDDTEWCEICKTCKIAVKFIKTVNIMLLNIWKKERNNKFSGVKMQKKKKKKKSNTIYKNFLISLIFVRKILKNLHFY